MAKKEECFAPYIDPYGDAEEIIESLITLVASAKKEGWTNLQFWADENEHIALWGNRPQSPEEVAAAREKRRKQYERLKREFE